MSLIPFFSASASSAAAISLPARRATGRWLSAVHTDFSFTVNRNEYNKAMELVNNIIAPSVGAVSVIGNDKVAKVSAVGIGMRSHVGVASKMFNTLSQAGINLQMISTSEIKISVIIEDKFMELAVRELHRVFDLENEASTDSV